MGMGGDATLAGTFMLGFRIATWILHLATIGIVGFFIGFTIYKFVKFVKASKQKECEKASEGDDNCTCEVTSSCNCESESACDCEATEVCECEGIDTLSDKE